MALAVDVEGKVVLVTGGTRGVGLGVATRFADAGAVVAVASRSEAPDLPSGWSHHQADVRDGESAYALVDAVVAEHGRIDVLVNNAGGSPPAETATASPRFTERVVALNLLSAIYCAQRANHHMQTSADGGAIVNIASVAARRPAPTVAAYGAAKAGLLSFTATVGQEWLPKVRVNAVTLGMVLTEQAHLHYGDDDAVARVAATIPMGRLASPVDVGNLCVFLASPLASYVSGATLVADGGGDRPPFLDAAG